MRKNMSKALEENKRKVTIKYFNFYWKFMCTGKNNDKKKMNLLPLSFHSFLNC